MPNTNSSPEPMIITKEEVSAVDKFRKLKDTSVLTIMFTDIKGFTRLSEEKGELYSHKILGLHNQLLVPAIEKHADGLIVKHIGDSIMAVFHEPSAAVAGALQIQENLRTFNAEHPELEAIEVRIGLHMGQVTVENQMQLDLFGRHVNRASRVESLADGGQIYLTYPVFDSAKGWLESNRAGSLAWVRHGKYFLKGIKTPIEIYEVSDKRHSQPRPPAQGRKKRNFPRWGVSLGIFLLGAGLALSLLLYQNTSVWFVKLHAAEVYLDQKEKIVLKGERTQEVRQALNRIPPGPHLLHYDIHWQVKYYMEILVKRGKNYIEPKFVENWLPALSRRLDFSADDKSRQEVNALKQFSYLLYDKANRKMENQAIIEFSIKGKQVPTQPEQVVFNLDWNVSLNGKDISREQMTLTSVLSHPESTKKTRIIYEDEEHYYYLKYFMHRSSAELEIGAAYIEYK